MNLGNECKWRGGLENQKWVRDLKGNIDGELVRWRSLRKFRHKGKYVIVEEFSGGTILHHGDFWENK